MQGVENAVIGFVLFLLGGVAAWVLIVFPMSSRRKGMAWSGVLSVKKHKYPYDMGDHLLRYGGMDFFAGIDIYLPKRMPHIYLDAHANDSRQYREFTFEKHNRISLEGDFDHTFKAYAPKNHKTLALSILTPDVMHTLMKHADRFDIEILEHHVRLIVPGARLLSSSEQLQHELMAAAKAVMKEVDHRLQSWNEKSLHGDTTLDIRQDNRVTN
jgi:hypothetical protein